MTRFVPTSSSSARPGTKSRTQRAAQSSLTAPRDLNLVERILRDYVSDDFTGIWIDNEEAVRQNRRVR